MGAGDPRAVRARRVAVAVAACLLGVTACGDAGRVDGPTLAAPPPAAEPAASAPAATAPAATALPPAPAAATQAASPAPAGLPEGDPGLDAPAVPEPPVDDAPAPAEAPRRSIPAAALLGPADLGDGWRAGPAPAPACAASVRATAVRRSGLVSDRGRLIETVTTVVDVPGTVAAWRSALRRCGYQVGELRLGEFGVRGNAPGEGRSVLVTGAENVVVVLEAHGALSSQREELDGYADMALGTSCPAAPDGCH